MTNFELKGSPGTDGAVYVHQEPNGGSSGGNTPHGETVQQPTYKVLVVKFFILALYRRSSSCSRTCGRGSSRDCKVLQQSTREAATVMVVVATFVVMVVVKSTGGSGGDCKVDLCKVLQQSTREHVSCTGPCCTLFFEISSSNLCIVMALFAF